MPREICTLRLCQRFRDFYQTVQVVNSDGQMSWMGQKISINRPAVRRSARRELAALKRAADAILARI
jgi:hypothetical protein